MSASKRIFIIALLSLLPSVAGAQMRIIPREKLDTSAFVKADFELETPLLEEDGEPYECVFSIPVEGPDSLRVSIVTTTCDCVRCLWSEAPVAPSDTFRVYVRYHQKRHPGRHDRRIYVFENGRNTPRYNLLLKTNVKETEL